MKNFLLYIIFFAIVLISFFYMLLSFANHELNPMLWKSIYRDYFFTIVILIVIVESFYYIKNKNK